MQQAVQKHVSNSTKNRLQLIELQYLTNKGGAGGKLANQANKQISNH
jgi:hypothetical protein